MQPQTIYYFFLFCRHTVFCNGAFFHRWLVCAYERRIVAIRMEGGAEAYLSLFVNYSSNCVGLSCTWCAVEDLLERFILYTPLISICTIYCNCRSNSLEQFNEIVIQQFRDVIKIIIKFRSFVYCKII